MTDWTEPAARLRLLWGGYRTRYLVGLSIIVLGIAATLLASTFSLWFLLIGPLVHLVGWLVMPGALWRRLVVAIPCLVSALVLLAGPDFLGVFAVLLAGWLLVRHRPLLSYLVLVLPIAASWVLHAALSNYGQSWIGIGSELLATIVAAWLARWLAIAQFRGRVRAGRIPSHTGGTLR